MRHKLPDNHTSHPNVTPLIDIVMCLIIFFMLIAKIGVSNGEDQSITVPATKLGLEMKDRSGTLTINVRKGTEDAPLVSAGVDRNGKTSGEPQELPVFDRVRNTRPLLEVLKMLRDGNKKAGIEPNNALRIVIRAEDDLDYRFIQPVLAAVSEAKVAEVAYATKKETER